MFSNLSLSKLCNHSVVTGVDLLLIISLEALFLISYSNNLGEKDYYLTSCKLNYENWNRISFTSSFGLEEDLSKKFISFRWELIRTLVLLGCSVEN